MFELFKRRIIYLSLVLYVTEGAERVVIDLKVDDRLDKDATIGTKKASVPST